MDYSLSKSLEAVATFIFYLFPFIFFLLSYFTYILPNQIQL